MYFEIEEGLISGWVVREVWRENGKRDKTLAHVYDERVLDSFVKALIQSGYKNATDMIVPND